MNPMSFHRLRGNLKALFAALGVGVLATMGALTVALPTPAGSTSPDRWKSDTTLTLTAPPMRPSAAPTLKSSYCDNKDPHAHVYGCS